ncbi:hypothetical protein B0H14DRAFT_3502711 [Mycena olivaceomarginata]|nr:hypothetical protein B0H14DRAFT_3502711 [Mycena olivaceomarginata]
MTLLRSKPRKPTLGLAEGKALKQEALDDFWAGVPHTVAVAAWVSQQQANSTRSAVYEAAERAAKEARLKNLIARRARAIKASKNKYHKENVDAQKFAGGSEVREKREQEVDEHGKNWAAAGFDLRMGPNFVPGPTPTSLMTSTTYTLSPAICLEIAHFGPLADRLTLLQVSRGVNLALRHLLYRNIAVRQSTKRLVSTLAHNPDLHPLVKSLYFMDESAGVDQEEWAYVFPGLRNLYFLGITPAIPLPFAILIRCRIRLFESLGPVTRRWEAFIRSQPCIEELILNSSFVAHPPGPATLPLLRGVKGLPQDVAKVAERHSRVLDMWFTSKQALAPEDLSRLAVSASRLETIRISALNLLLLLSAAPSFVSTLQHVSLDEDETWRDFTLQKPEGLSTTPLARVAAVLSSLVKLERILLACSRDATDRSFRLLSRADAAADGLMIWEDWGRPNEKIFQIGGHVDELDAYHHSVGYAINFHYLNQIAPFGERIACVQVSRFHCTLSPPPKLTPDAQEQTTSLLPRLPPANLQTGEFMAVPTATELAAIAAIQKADKEAAHECWLVHFVAPIYDNIVQWGQGKLKDESDNPSLSTTEGAERDVALAQAITMAVSQMPVPERHQYLRERSWTVARDVYEDYLRCLTEEKQDAEDEYADMPELEVDEEILQAFHRWRWTYSSLGISAADVQQDAQAWAAHQASATGGWGTLATGGWGSGEGSASEWPLQQGTVAGGWATGGWGIDPDDPSGGWGSGSTWDD